MSVMFVLWAPMMVESWPALSSAIYAATGTMGYHLEEMTLRDSEAGNTPRGVTLTMENSQVISDRLMRGESFTMQGENGMGATFRVDGRGACQVHVSGLNKTNAELEEEARNLMKRVRQQFTYAKIMAELEQRGFQVTEETLGTDNTIQIRVQR